MGIHKGDGGGGGGGDLVMIEDDHVHAVLLQPGNRVHGCGTAIHGQEQGDGEFLQAVLHALLAQTITFVPAMGQIAMDRPTERAQDFDEEGGGRNAIHVVIAEEDERLVLFTRAEKAFDRGGHVREKKRIGQLFEPGLEEAADSRRFTEAAVQKALREQRGDVQSLR